MKIQRPKSNTIVRRVFLCVCTTVLIAGAGWLLFAGASHATTVDARASSAAIEEASANFDARRASRLSDTSKTEADDRSVVGSDIDGPFGAAPGKRFRYRLKSSTDFGLAKPDVAAPDEMARIAFEGELALTVEDRDAKHVLVAMQCSAFRMAGATSADVDCEEQVRAMRASTHIRIDLDGRPNGLAFQNDVTADGRDFVRNAVALLFYRVGAPTDGTWRLEPSFAVEESDATGRFAAAYRGRLASAGVASYERRKRAYVAMNAALATVPPHEAHGATNVSFDRGLRWLSRVSVDEQLTMQAAELEVRVVTATTAEIELVTHDSVPTGELASLGSFAEDAFESPRGEDQSGQLSAAARLDILRRDYAGLGIDDMVDSLRDALARHGIDAAETYDAWRRLGEFLELHPDRCTVVLQHLQSGAVKGELAGLFISALGAAGSDAAQGILVEVAASPAFDIEARQLAVVATQQLATPRPDLLESLRRRIENASAFEVLDGASALAFGTLSGRSVDRLANGKTALETLLALEGKARRGGWLDTWLEALGNVGSSAVFDALARYCADNDVGLRAVAARVIGRLPDPRVAAVLAARVQVEAEDLGRQALADAFGDQPRGSADEHLRMLALERSVAVQLRAVTQLGRRSDVAQNVSLLRELLASPACNEEVRKVVKEILVELDRAKG